MFEILPKRLQQWQSSTCVSELHNKQQLEQIRRQQLECKHKLYELEQKSAELESVIQEAKQVTATDNEVSDEQLYSKSSELKFAPIAVKNQKLSVNAHSYNTSTYQ